jgi:hypothetical protein
VLEKQGAGGGGKAQNIGGCFPQNANRVSTCSLRRRNLVDRGAAMRESGAALPGCKFLWRD